MRVERVARAVGSIEMAEDSQAENVRKSTHVSNLRPQAAPHSALRMSKFTVFFQPFASLQDLTCRMAVSEFWREGERSCLRPSQDQERKRQVPTVYTVVVKSEKV